MSALRLTAAA